jgi:hypothetical protein
MKKSLLLLIVIAIAFTSCKKDPDATGNLRQTPANVNFLQVGNSWTYDSWLWFTNDTLTVTIVSKDANNDYYVTLDMKNNSQPDWQQYWYMDGNTLYAYPDGEPTNVRKLWELNAALNSTWTATNTDGTITYTIHDLDTTVATLSGDTFNSILINHTFDYAFNEENAFWSDDYGQVYQDGLWSLDLISKNF